MSWQQKYCSLWQATTFYILEGGYLIKYFKVKTTVQSCFKNQLLRVSLVVQCLRIRLPMQGTQVRALVQEDPTCCRATKPMRHNY